MPPCNNHSEARIFFTLLQADFERSHFSNTKEADQNEVTVLHASVRRFRMCAPIFTVFIPKKNRLPKLVLLAIFISTPYTSFTGGAGSSAAIIVPAAVVKLKTPVLCTTRFF